MVVDFKFKRTPKYRVATFAWKGPWKESRIRSEFEKVAKWASQKGVRTGKWVFMEPGDKHFQVGVELKSKLRGEGDIHVTTLPAVRVASVVYDPDKVSPRVVYHGITDWLRWRKKDGEIKGVGAYREVYEGNPWTNAKAWANTDVQVVVR
ncbi:MAG: GyrI-like domain-containing protein [Thermoplasmata archaeon]|nr:GyrI-like domain-containing protein [Thermoplasmata archaeon]